MTDQDGIGRAAAEMLRWYAEMGVDTIVGHTPADRLGAPVPESSGSAARPAERPRAPAPVSGPVPESRPPTVRPDAATEEARSVAAACRTLDDLRAALETFEGCALKESASRLVFADGAAGSEIMLIGEAPGREEDRQGKPFVGRSGQLLDRMLAALGLSRAHVYISNIVPWRPPLNRKPELGEIEICLPFLLRHVELAAPKVVMTLGGTATQHLLGTSGGILSLRGRWLELQTETLRAPVLPTLHPAYLLRTPAQKRLAWQDFLTVKLWLEKQRN